MREVTEKRKRWREHDKKKQADLLGKHMIPVVYGPDARYYVIDHHHLGRALLDEGVKEVLVTVVGDLRMVEREAFWGVMDNKRWVYPYDAKGERRSFRDLPKSVADLKDDPFRSLAGELRRMGGFAKALWIIALLVLPVLTALVYIIARGRGMAHREIADERKLKSQADAYIREVAQTTPADQIVRAKTLLREGAITEAEFAELKAAALAH